MYASYNVELIALHCRYILISSLFLLPKPPLQTKLVKLKSAPRWGRTFIGDTILFKLAIMQIRKKVQREPYRSCREPVCKQVRIQALQR